MDDSGKKNAAPSGKDGDGVRITAHGHRGARSALLYKALALVPMGRFQVCPLTMKAATRPRSQRACRISNPRRGLRKRRATRTICPTTSHQGRRRR